MKSNTIIISDTDVLCVMPAGTVGNTVNIRLVRSTDTTQFTSSFTYTYTGN